MHKTQLTPLPTPTANRLAPIGLHRAHAVPAGWRKHSQSRMGAMRGFAIIVQCVAMCACSTAPKQPVSFTGTWVGNEAESVMLPGQHVPKNMISVIKDDGRYLQTDQIFTDEKGKEVRRFTWNGLCDGVASVVLGVDPPGIASLSCERIDAGAFIMTLRDKKGYRHVETCRMSSDGRKHSCKGTATLPDGSKHDFEFVFDKK